MSRRRAASTRLDPGEHSIDRATVTERVLKGKPVQVLDWAVRLHDGRLLDKQRTQGATATEVKRKAKKRAAELLAGGGHSPWKGRDPITKYLDEVTAKAFEDAGLRDDTLRQYRRAQAHLKRELTGYSISAAWHYDVLVRALYSIRDENGPESARQAKTVLGKYVAQPLMRHRLTDRYPLQGAKLDLKRGAKPSARPKTGGQGLKPDEQERVIVWLLGLDPAEGVEKPKRGRWGIEVRIAKRRRTIDLTLLQAGTGLRIGEALQVTRKLLYDGDGGVLHVNVTKDIAKTGIARQVPVYDPRIEAHLRKLLDQGTRPDEYLIGAPSDAMKRWGKTGNGGAAQQVAALYQQMAEELDVPLMEHARTHLWRTTLGSRLAEAGVDREDYAATLGHDEETNEKHYTEGVPTSRLAAAYRAKHVN